MTEPTSIRKIALFPDKPHVELTAYIAGTSGELPHNEKRKAILVIPGGGYYYCSDREADPVAHYFLAHGMNAFTLNYSVVQNGDPLFPNPLIEASAAIAYIRGHAEELHVDPDAIYVVGFSAGGHLAASIGTLWHLPIIAETLQIPHGQNRPTGVILAYPVISGLDYAHRGSFDRILGDRKDDEAARRELSLELRVSDQTVPTFLWTTRTDAGVPVQNTLLYAKALADHGIPFEMHIYPIGGHGASIGTAVVDRTILAIKQWKVDALRWMNVK